MKLTLVTAPSAEPVVFADVSANIYLNASDTTTVADKIQAARAFAETYLGRALLTQTWDLVLEDWPDGREIVVPLPPLASVTSVEYTDADGTVHTLIPTTDYLVSTTRDPGRIVLPTSGTWPSDDLYATDPITVRFVAGYADAEALKEAKPLIWNWIVQAASWLYQHREEADLGMYPVGAIASERSRLAHIWRTQ